MKRPKSLWFLFLFVFVRRSARNEGPLAAIGEDEYRLFDAAGI
jgi:hypothetical protein